jgi:hypothetical protein
MNLHPAEAASANSKVSGPVFAENHSHDTFEVLFENMLLPRLNPRALVAAYGEINC